LIFFFTILDWVPAPEQFDTDSEAEQLVRRFQTLFHEARQPRDGLVTYFEPVKGEEDAASVSRVLQMVGVGVGDKVVVGGIKTGIMRYCGSTAFASGY